MSSVQHAGGADPRAEKFPAARQIYDPGDNPRRALAMQAILPPHRVKGDEAGRRASADLAVSREALVQVLGRLAGLLPAIWPGYALPTRWPLQCFERYAHAGSWRRGVARRLALLGQDSPVPLRFVLPDAFRQR